MNKQLQKAITALVFAVLFLALAMTDAFYHADMLLCDGLYKKLEGQTRDIKIIAIDEKTLGAYGKFETWSREKSAELTELLSADPNLAPAVLAFDIMFIGDSDPQVDARLAAAFQKAGNVVCASNLVYKGKMETDADGNLVYNPAAIEREELPFAEALQAVQTGFANNCISDDNIVRYAQLFAGYNGKSYTSFAYTAYRAYAEKMGLPVCVPETLGGQTGFFYSGNPGDVPHVSLVDVLEGKIPLSEFAGCLVLVGAYAAGFQDSYNPAVARGQQMYGVEINANIVLALMNDKLAKPVAAWLYALPLAAVLAAWVFFLDKQKLWAVLAEAAVLVGVHLAAGRLLALNGVLIPQVYFAAVVVTAVIYSIIGKYVVEKIKRRHALSTLKKYVAPQIVEKLSKNGDFALDLVVEKKHIAALFVDVRGFTTMSESLPPEEVVQMLDRYLSVATQAVFANEGTLDKFIGDATMAIFNAPFDLEDYIFKAVRTAWDIQTGVAELAKIMDKPIRVGVGINCGEAVVGNIGCEVRMDYTAIGDTVNTAARLESNAKPGQILISQAVYDAVGQRLRVEPMGELSLKGKLEKVPVYNVTGFAEREKGVCRHD